MFKRFILPCIAAAASLVFLTAGCATGPQMSTHSDAPAASLGVTKPILASAGPVVPPTMAAPTTVSPNTASPNTASAEPSTRPSEIIAELKVMQVTRDQLDALLYETYGLQMTFDIVELELAKNTLWVREQKKIEPADVQRERDLVFSKMFQDAQKSDYEGLYAQFLQKEKYTRAEFEMRAIETSAVLRKLIEPLVIGKIPDAAIRRGFEIMYGANRTIADITVANQLDAQKAEEMLKTQSFDAVAHLMSIDKETRDNGGKWAPFSAQSTLVPKVIIDAAFSQEVGQVSDPLLVGTTQHIIKVVNVTDPKAVKYDDVKDLVKKQMEDKLVEKNMKDVRQELQLMAQTQIKFHNPILKAQWDEILAKQQPAAADKKDVLKQMDQHMGPDLNRAAVPTAKPSPK